MVHLAERADVQAGRASSVPVGGPPRTVVVYDLAQHFRGTAGAHTATIHHQKQQGVAILGMTKSRTGMQFVPEINLLHPTAIHDQGVGIAANTLGHVLLLAIDGKRQFEGNSIALVQAVQLGLHGSVTGQYGFAGRNGHRAHTHLFGNYFGLQGCCGMPLIVGEQLDKKFGSVLIGLRSGTVILII